MFTRDEAGKMVEIDESQLIDPEYIKQKVSCSRTDSVNRPPHYIQGDIEPIDYIRDKLSKDQFVGYCTGNVLKYVSRWQHKGGIEDLRKAEVYLRWAIEREVME